MKAEAKAFSAAVLGFGAIVGLVYGLGMLAPAAAVKAQAPASYGFITYADITGNAAAQQVDATVGHSCRYIQIVTPSTNSTTLVRWGDSNISATRGGTIAAGGGQFLPPLPNDGSNQQRYDVTKLYVLAASNDKVTVVCGQ